MKYAQLALSALARGFWPLFLRPAGVNANWSASILLFAIGIVSGLLLARAGARGARDAERRRLREWWVIVPLGVCLAGSTLLYFTALQLTSVAVAVMFHCFAPLIVAVAAPWVLGTPPSVRVMLLALLAVIGLVLVMEPWLASGSSLAGTLQGAGLGAGAAVFASGYLILNKRIGARFTPEERLVASTMMAGSLCVAAALVLDAPLPRPAGAAIIALGGATLGAAGWLLFLYGLQRVPAEQAGMLMLVEPLTGLAVAWLVWNEHPGPVGIAGAVLVALVAALALYEPKRDERSG